MKQMFKQAAVLAALIISGCGGGGGGGDNESQTLSLTLSGKVTDAPIAHAQVAVLLSSLDDPFETTADADGNYSITITVDERRKDDFVVIAAKGVGQQEQAGLISIAGTVSRLKEQAGEDNILTPDENFSVQVTNITTAQYALMMQSLGDSEIASDEELETLLSDISSEDTLQLAAAIKVAIDMSSDDSSLAMQDSVTNTLQLIESPENIRDYLSKISGTSAFQESLADIANDDNLHDSSGYSVPENYYFYDSCYDCIDIGSASFNEDNTGAWYFPNLSFNTSYATFTWTELNGVIDVSFDEQVLQQNIVLDTASNAWVEVQNQLRGIKIKSVGAYDDFDQLVLIMKWTKVEDLQVVTWSEETEFIVGYKKTKAITNTNIKKVFASVWLKEFDEGNDWNTEILFDAFTLSDNNLGASDIEQLQIEWQLVDGKLIITNYEQDMIVSQVNDSLLLVEYASEIAVINGRIDATISKRVIGPGRIVTVLPSWDNANTPGFYTFERSAFDDPNDHYWYELNSDGTAASYGTFDYDQDGTLSDWEVIKRYGDWEIDQDGKLVITRYMYEDFRPGCNPEIEDCIVYGVRKWDVYNRESGQHEVFNLSDFPNYEFKVWTSQYIYKVSERPVALPPMSQKAAKGIATPVVEPLNREIHKELRNENALWIKH